MRWVFLLLSLLAFAFAALVLSVAASAVHEIEAGILFVVAAVLLVGYSVASIRRPTPSVDNAEHLARIVELLDWLKKAKAQELREAAKRSGP
jgi:hypothetical protein